MKLEWIRENCIFQHAESASKFYERCERNETMEEMTILTKFEKLTSIAEQRIENRLHIVDLCMWVIEILLRIVRNYEFLSL